MNPCRLNRRIRPRAERNGSIAVLAALMSIVLLGMVAFTVDMGYVLSSHQEVQRSADAAAMATCWELAKKRSEGVSVATAIAESRVVAADYASANAVGNAATTIDANVSNSTAGDLVFGYLDDIYDAGATLQTTGAPYFNSVKVRVRRNDSYNGKVPYFFARVFGATGQELEAEATAACLRNVGGFEIPYDGSNIGILPIALDIETWEDMLYDDIGENDFAWNDETKTLSPGEDDWLEVNLFPQATGSPGNRGTVDIGSNNNSTNDIARQILYGVSPSDLAFHGGKLEFDQNGELILNGDTGISAGVKDELESIKGEPRMIPIFNNVVGPGNNANYTIVQWVGIRIVEVKLTGPMNAKRVIVQPAGVVTKGAIPANQSNQSNFVYSPVVLVK